MAAMAGEVRSSAHTHLGLQRVRRHACIHAESDRADVDPAVFPVPILHQRVSVDCSARGSRKHRRSAFCSRHALDGTPRLRLALGGPCTERRLAPATRSSAFVLRPLLVVLRAAGAPIRRLAGRHLDPACSGSAACTVCRGALKRRVLATREAGDVGAGCDRGVVAGVQRQQSHDFERREEDAARGEHGALGLGLGRRRLRRGGRRCRGLWAWRHTRLTLFASLRSRRVSRRLVADGLQQPRYGRVVRGVEAALHEGSEGM